MSAIRRRLIACLAVPVAAATLILPGGSAAADPPVGPTMSVTAGGQPAAGVAVNDTLDVTGSAPISQVGQTNQRIETTWDPAQLAVSTGSIVRPEGWDLEYTADGTNWTSSAPAPSTTIRGVRSSGSVESDGLAGGLQVSTATGTGSVRPGTGSFAGSSGGDGWDAFVSGDFVLNVWHHSGDTDSTYHLDCHDKTSGASCGSVYSVAGYRTGPGSSGNVVGNKVYSLVARTATSSYGVLCTDISALPFTSCGFTSLLTSSGGFSHYKLGTQSISGTKIYAPVTDNGGKLVCYDISVPGACTGQPYALTGFSSTLTGGIRAYSFADSDRVVVTANEIWCFDAATGAACTGSWPVGSYSGTIHPAVPMRDIHGVLTGACTILPVGDCYDLTGATATYPPALASLLADEPVGGGASIGWGQYDFSPTRQYWLTGSDWTGPMPPVCWDWTTQAACDGFTSPESTGIQRYALRLDPTNQNCIWTNGDNGQISSFDAFTGAAGCPGPDPTVVVPYTTAVPRMGCLEEGRVRAFRDLTLTNIPSGVPVTTLKVSVVASDGNPVTGFVDLNPDTDGVVDLTTLSPDDTGLHPSFEITSPNTPTTAAAQITAAVRFESDAPQLCVTLTVRQDCPALDAGISPAATVPVADMTIDGQAVATVGGTETPTPLSATVTRADMGDCLGAVSGTASRTFPGGSTPLAGGTVDLLDPSAAVVASTTTAGDGTYSFANVNPAAYTVSLAGQSGPATVTAAATATVDVDVPVDDPTADDVSSATLQNRPVSFAISATSDASTTIDLSTVQLRDPVGGGWGSSVTVAGEGEWTVTDDGDLQFTPEPGFTGTTTSIQYRVADGYGTTAAAHAEVDVSEVPPTAAPVEVTGVRGDILTITPNGVGPTVDLVDSSLKLIDPSDGSRVGTLVVANVGTFVVDPSTGTVLFTPLAAFTGSTTVIYQVVDELGRTAISTMQVTLEPIALSGGSETVDADETATVPVGGVPDGSTLTAPPTVDGAASVSIDGSHVVVVPVAGFTGRITVPVTVTHGTASLVTEVTVDVRPAPVTGDHYLVNVHHTVVRWAGTTGAERYEVSVNGVLKCRTTRHSCNVMKLLGTRSRVVVVAVGGDGLRSVAARLPYHRTQCHGLGTVYFASASAVLRPSAVATLKGVVHRMAVLGFPTGCLVGHTDNRGSAAYNLALSRRRVAMVAAYLHARVHGLSLKGYYSGELLPAAPNNTAAGRAANRRVEIGIN